MKRDMDLIRDILLAVEKEPYTRSPFDLQIAGRTPAEVGYHVMLLDEAGLITSYHAQAISELDAASCRPISLTWAGHEFLDAARSSEHWAKVKQIVTEKGGGMVLDVVKALLIEVSKRAAVAALTT